MVNLSWRVCFAFAASIVVGEASTIRVPQDQPTIQAAIGAAVAFDVILVSKGTYTDAVSITGKSDLTIKAKGKVTIDTGNGIDPPLTVANSDRITVKGLRVSTSSVDAIIGTNSDDLVLDGVRVLQAGGSGINVVSGSRTRVRKCVTGATGGDGVSLSAPDSFVSQCTVSGAGGVGISLFGTRTVAIGNKVTNSGAAGILVVTSDCIVDKNTIRGSAGSNLHASPGTRGVLRNNVMKDGASFGLQISGGQVRAEKNSISKCAATGIRIDGDDAVVTENTVTKAGDDGVRIENGADTCVLHRNVVKSPVDVGFVIAGASGFITENVSKSPGSQTTYSFGGSSNVSYENN